jgi:hypothetical protein
MVKKSKKKKKKKKEGKRTNKQIDHLYYSQPNRREAMEQQGVVTQGTIEYSRRRKEW